jgi:hypothetical protein
MSKNEELANPGLSVTFLERMEDVTSQVLANVSDLMGESERQAEIQKQIQKIEYQASEGGKFRPSVRSFFYGNEFYLFVYKVYTDVRLVGAPPSAIGKFGGDTDNWMWPRHTGDFSLFRIYAGKDNEPADYSPDNVPYKPKKHFSVSMKGVQKGDFTMVFGYPGNTQEYLSSYAVKMISDVQNPSRISIRQEKINIIGKSMDMDPLIRIKYTSKYAGISNSWKKWIGENRGLKRLDAIQKKEQFEKNISDWMKANPERDQKYSYLLPEFKKVYEKLSPYQLAADYTSEAIFSLEISRLARNYRDLANLNEDSGPGDYEKIISNLKNGLEGHFKDIDPVVDKEVFAKMITMLYQNLDKQFHPEELKLLETKFKGNIGKYVDFLYSKSMFPDKSKLEKFLQNYKPADNKILLKDPIYALNAGFVEVYLKKILPVVEESTLKLEKLNRLWMKAIMEFEKDRILYPDANFTLRVSYGKVDDYKPLDGVKYLHYTTLKGIMEKDNPDIYDYDVPAKLKQLYKTKDYGDYAENGEIHVAFIASNHTTGGNSGSPV